jgi:hypothetical protein
MQATDRTKFLEVLAGVHDFYGKEMSAFAGQVWMQAAHGFELEQVTKALSAHLMDPERGQFMPKPADIVRQLQGTATDRSLIAWGKVLDAISRVGAYQSVVFDDGAIHAAIADVGGWASICRTTNDELPFLQKRFTDLHKAYTNRGKFDYPSRLMGEHELTNRLNGRPVAQPYLIGDADKAQKVAQLGVSGSKTAIAVADAVPPLRIAGKAA